MGFSEQRFQGLQPSEQDSQLILTIECGDCRAWRNFRVNQTLAAVIKRELRSMGVEAECEVCGSLIDIGIGWVPGSSIGYVREQSARGPEFARVRDAVGLHRHEERTGPDA